MGGGAFDLVAAHRELDAMLGRFLAAAGTGAVEDARASIAEFDDALRRHTAHEEEYVFPPPPARKLVAPITARTPGVPGEDGEESAEARLSRELRLEHVQIREVSGMMRRLLEERGDLEGAKRLFGNLARRWDSHTAREELAVASALI
jgi:hypothetical protein